jgi:hypothetical protein
MVQKIPPVNHNALRLWASEAIKLKMRVMQDENANMAAAALRLNQDRRKHIGSQMHISNIDSFSAKGGVTLFATRKPTNTTPSA